MYPLFFAHSTPQTFSLCLSLSQQACFVVLSMMAVEGLCWSLCVCAVMVCITDSITHKPPSSNNDSSFLFL